MRKVTAVGLEWREDAHVGKHVKSSSPQPCWCIPQPGSCSLKWFCSCTSSSSAAWSEACCLLSSRSEGTDVGNTVEKFILFLGNISQASWINSIPKEQPQGFPECPQPTHAQWAILHYPVEELSSAQTAQTGLQKHNPGTQSSCSVWEGLLPGRWAASRRHFPQQLNRGCPKLEPKMLPGGMGCPAQTVGSDSHRPPHPWQDTAFPPAQAHFSTGCILSN